VILDTLFGEGQTGPKILLFLVVVLGLLALAFWLLRRFGGGRLGSSATRGRQPRLAMIDQAAIDNRRRLILIRRDNVEHLLIIGGPTDVVIEQNIVRAAGATLAPGRPATATDTLPRAVPLGEDTMWPLQPEPAPKPEAAPRVEPTLRSESAPRPQRPPAGVEEPIHWPGESGPPVTAAPDPMPAPPPRKPPRPVDPLAGLAEELARIPPAPDPGGVESRQPPRRGPRPPLPGSPAGHTPDAPPALAPGDQNLSEMAQRLEAALRRSPKSADRSGGGERLGEPAAPRPEPAAPGLEDFAPSPGSRLGAALRRPFRTDDARASPFAPKTTGEPAAPGMDEFAPAPSSPRFDAMPRRPFRTDDARPAPSIPSAAGEPAASEAPEVASPPPHVPESTDVADAADTTTSPDGKPAPQKSMYDSLEQEMASLLNRPPSKP
jgi:flagellar protein FliO/FliZ